MKLFLAGSFIMVMAAGVFAEEKKAATPQPALIEEGKKVFTTNCASCHGPTGAGDGVAAAALDPKPRDISDAAYMKTRPAATIRKVVEEGGASVGLSPMMIGWKAILTPEQINGVLAYIEILQKPVKKPKK
jgi:mono/diheme cytochrome c family protein